MLSQSQLRSFITDGFVHLPAAVPRHLVTDCRDRLWRATGCDPDDPATWTRPVIRLEHFAEAPFRAAANTQQLHEAFDQLVGKGRWRERGGLGTFPVRFPGDDPAAPVDPGDTGWHLDAGYVAEDGTGRVSLGSRGRALLMLFLFSDVGPDDAPTRIRVGSHQDVPALLPDNDSGREWFELCQAAVPLGEHRREVTATGSAGDVYLCHPFLIHAAQPHRGARVRFMAQPPLELLGRLDLTSAAPSPVEAAVINAMPKNQ